MNLLIVEDEKQLAKEINSFLTKEGFLCHSAYTGKDASEMIAVNEYDFILIDIGLPDYNGLDLINEAKKLNPEAYFIIITARGELEDKIKGFEYGADDYLAKPFSLLELGSRLNAIARRKFNIKSSEVNFGNFTLDINKKSLFFEGKAVDLTKKEYDLISYMILNKNKIMNRLQLTEHIWGDFFEDDFDSNYIDVHIKNIRKKLGKHDQNQWIKTIRGIGYKFEN